LSKHRTAKALKSGKPRIFANALNYEGESNEKLNALFMGNPITHHGLSNAGFCRQLAG
jgi:hypothetical protein